MFGLVHGFGFYGVLRDLHLSQQGLMLSLCAFNLGVEVGQVLLVAVLSSAGTAGQTGLAAAGRCLPCRC